MRSKRAEKICRLQRSAELLVLTEDTSDCSISIVKVSLQSIGGRIEIETEFDSWKIKIQVVETWKAFFLTGDGKLWIGTSQTSIKVADLKIYETPYIDREKHEASRNQQYVFRKMQASVRYPEVFESCSTRSKFVLWRVAKFKLRPKNSFQSF